jgi:RNA polymerase sigma-70 factor (ECF subfamily)
MPPDEELMMAVRHGDLRAFEELVVRHQTSAWRAAYRFLGDSAEAEDVAQEAFLKIFGAASRYQPTAAFRTYLYRVVTRLCLDRAQKKQPVYSETLPDRADGSPAPFDVLAVRERKQAVREALERLPPNQRMAVILRYDEGLGYAAIAVALETSCKAVERLLARAREALEKRLGHLLE